jgi:hypothetical protein
MTPGGDAFTQGPVLNFQGLSVLSKTAGATLVELTGQAIARPNVPQSPSSLYGFSALRVLDWQSPAKLKFLPTNVPADALAKLETLSFASVCDSFLSLLGHMKYVLVYISHRLSLAKRCVESSCFTTCFIPEYLENGRRRCVSEAAWLQIVLSRNQVYWEP